MKVKLKQDMAINGVELKSGDIAEVSEAEARVLVCSGQASYAKPPKMMAEPIPENKPAEQPRGRNKKG